MCYYIYCLHGHNSTVWVYFFNELINAYLPDTCEKLPVQQFNLEGSLQSLPTLLAAKNCKFGQDSALCLGSISLIWWFYSTWFDGNVLRFSEGRTCCCVLFFFCKGTNIASQLPVGTSWSSCFHWMPCASNIQTWRHCSRPYRKNLHNNYITCFFMFLPSTPSKTSLCSSVSKKNRHKHEALLEAPSKDQDRWCRWICPRQSQWSS